MTQHIQMKNKIITILAMGLDATSEVEVGKKMYGRK